VTAYEDNIAKVVVFCGGGRRGGIWNSEETAKVQEAQAGVRRPRTEQPCLPSLEAAMADKRNCWQAHIGWHGYSRTRLFKGPNTECAETVATNKRHNKMVIKYRCRICSTERLGFFFQRLRSRCQNVDPKSSPTYSKAVFLELSQSIWGIMNCNTRIQWNTHKKNKNNISN